MPFNIQDIQIEDNWSAKKLKHDDNPAISYFRKNLGAKQLIGNECLQHQVYVTAKYLPADDTGCPSAKDHKNLYDFEEIDIPEIENKSNSIHVASVLQPGVKDHIFYVSNPDIFLKVLNQYLMRIDYLKIDLECNLDPQWETYIDFP